MTEPLRTLPANPDLERTVLSGLMEGRVAIEDVAEILAPGDFFDPAHRMIYGAMLQLHADGKPYDIVGVADALDVSGKLAHAGGLDYLAEVQGDYYSGASTMKHARMVKEKAVYRDLVRTGAEIMDLGYEQADVDDALQMAQAKVMTIGQAVRVEEMAHVNLVARDTIDEIDRLFNSRLDLIGLSSGYDRLDEFSLGFERGSFVILAGRPSMGKTCLAMNIIERAALADVPCLVFSLEMPRQSLMMRMYSSLSGIHFKKIRRGRLNEEDWPYLTAAVNKLKDKPLWIDDTAGLTIHQLRTKIRDTIRRTGQKPGYIMVDYIQIMGGTGAKGETELARITTISRELKSMAKEFDCVVIALSQLNRGVESRPNKRPNMSDLRESGALEQDADVIILMYRDEYYNPDTPHKGCAEAIFGKNRNGETGAAYLEAQLEFMRFLDWKYPNPKYDEPGDDKFAFLDHKRRAAGDR